MITKPNFHSHNIFADNFIIVELRKLEVKFNKPNYVSMLLDTSKILYQFHHEHMSSMYRDKYKIIYTDTDNLIYRVEDVYENETRYC